MRNPLNLLARKLRRVNLNPLGRKEKDAQRTPFLISCVSCGKPVSVEETNCPPSIKKHIVRNWKTRTAASLILAKLRPQCSECAKKGKPVPVTETEAYDLARQAVDEAKEGRGKA